MAELELYESFNDEFQTLPVKVYRHNLSGKNIYSPLHWHRSVELTVTLCGSVRFNCGSYDLDCRESEWLFVNSCELHSCRYITPADEFTGITIIFSNSFIEKWLGKNLFFYNPENPLLSIQFKSLASEIFQMDPEIPSYELKLMSKIFLLLDLISEHCVKSDVKHPSIASNSDTISMFTNYIEQHYQDQISLSSVAEHFQYSPAYFSRLFKQEMGVNFNAYLSYVRVSHSMEQLYNGCDNLTECAFHNGFPNVKSFIQAFKKQYGSTPGSFLASL